MSQWSMRVRAGATPEILPDPNVEWTWQAQQAYAVRTAERVNTLEATSDRAANLSLVLAAGLGLLGGVVAAGGLLALRRAR